MVLPSLLTALNEDQWRTKSGKQLLIKFYNLIVNLPYYCMQDISYYVCISSYSDRV